MPQKCDATEGLPCTPSLLTGQPEKGQSRPLWSGKYATSMIGGPGVPYPYLGGTTQTSRGLVLHIYCHTSIWTSNPHHSPAKCTARQRPPTLISGVKDLGPDHFKFYPLISNRGRNSLWSIWYNMELYGAKLSVSLLFKFMRIVSFAMLKPVNSSHDWCLQVSIAKGPLATVSQN